MAQEVTLTNEQKTKASLHPLTQTDKPALVDGTAVWELVGTSVSITPSADGLSCDIISSDTDLGVSTINVSADADLGAGVVTLTDTITCTVVHAQAVTLGLTLGSIDAK